MIVIDQTEVCYGEWHTADSGCPPGSLVQWVGLYAPSGVNASDIEFEADSALITRYRLPSFAGTYGISVKCRTPK